ncbi:MAG: hypothetical protein ACYTF5_08240 [Planctomycetota bacterium]
MHPRHLVSILTLAPVLASLAGAQVPERRKASPQQPTAPWVEIGLDQGLDWIRDPQVFVDHKRGRQLKVDRKELLEMALERAEKEGKLVMWYVYRVLVPYQTPGGGRRHRAGGQMYRAPILDIYAQHVLFADQDVQGVIKAGFVPLRMVYDQKMSERFGLKPLDFVEPAVVFLDHKGNVVHYVERIRTFSAHWFEDLLRRVWSKHYDAARKAVGKATDAAAKKPPDLKMRHLMLNSQGGLSPAEVYEFAVLKRKLRNPKGALKSLDDISRVMGKPTQALLDDATCERGLILTLEGLSDQAIPHLEKAFRGKGKRAAEAGYLLATNHLRLGNVEGANKIFDAVVQRFPDTTWGRKAKVNRMIGDDQRPVGPTFAGFEHLTWLPAAAYQGLPKDTTWAGKAASQEQLAVHAMRFLLRQQRLHGGFTDARYAYWRSPKITPNVWIAITALAATALTEFRDIAPNEIDPGAVDAAVAKAKKFLFDPKRLNRGENEDVYADTYRLLFLARQAGKADADQKQNILAMMDGVVKDASARQLKTHPRKKGVEGFWAHEYPNAFCTAAMLWGLHDARKAGAKVPDEVIDKGLGALLRAREASGGFVYGGSVRKGSKRTTPLKDTSTRMPVCEGALLAFGRSDKQKLLFAFETFWKYMHRIENVRRNDFHSDGQLGGFFFFHALYHASEANKLLPAGDRRKNNKKFLEVLQEIPEMDGSFVDSHELGRSYGTAMALLTLKNVMGE